MVMTMLFFCNKTIDYFSFLKKILLLDFNKPIIIFFMKNFLLSVFLLFSLIVTSFGQITNSTLSGVVKDESGSVLIGANVNVIHIPTGTEYNTTTNLSGAYVVPSVRVGGPYTIEVSYVGYETGKTTDVITTLGVTTNVNVVLYEGSTELGEAVIFGRKDKTFSKDRTGAAEQFSRNEIMSIPTTGSRSINSITKYNPFGDGSSFGSQDSRLNNFTIDGSQFNNGFGLGSSSQAGGRTGSTAISLDAIEQIQLNVAPYDIRQSGFVGAGINAVTRSGTNEVEGSVYGTTRNNSSAFVGNSAYGVPVTASKFNEQVLGARIGLPIIKNKLFIFANYEGVTRTEPGTTWISDGSPLTGSQISRVKYSDMETLSNFMRDNFGYETGPWEGYNNLNGSQKGLVRLDWNINRRNKLTARYIHHNSSAEINISNSQSAGAGNRTTQFNAMSFKNSGYIIQDNTRSGVIELSSMISNTLSNNFIVGYDKQIEDRAYLSPLFPTIDIREGAATYTSVGFDPFTPGNQLNYGTFHVTNNLTKYYNKHTITAGVNFERYESANLFYPASNGVYVFNSLQDFYTAANESIANNGSPSTFAPARFQMRYSALPNGEEPLQILKSNRLDLYLQDEFDVTQRFKLTAGIRTAYITFGNTALENEKVSAMTFANGEKFNTGVLPKPQLLWEPRIGFNYDVNNDGTFQIRGGSGIFTGRPPYVFLSNQVGNNGVLTGFIDVSGEKANGYGFTTNPNQYFTPETPTLPTTFDLAFTDANYRFPQVWKSNIAIDKKLPLGFVGSVEYLYNRSVNAVHYYNANLDSPTGTFNGVDNRERYANNDNGVRVNDNVSMGAVLTNINGPYHQSITLKLEYPYQKGLWGTFAYTYSDAKDFMSAGSIASGSWQGAKSVNGNNNLQLSNSDNLIRNRFVGLVGYRFEYGKSWGGATTITLGYVGQQSNPYSYFIAGDMNGDRVRDNELMFVPLNASDLSFVPLTVGSRTFSVQEQREALDAFIDQDPYLSTRRGQYAERNGSILPYLHRFDLSVAQDFNILIGGKKNSFQVRIDILNAANLINDNWGVSQRATAPALLNFVSSSELGEPVYRMSTQKLVDGTTILAKDTHQRNSSVFDVWTAQLGLRYTFGR